MMVFRLNIKTATPTSTDTATSRLNDNLNESEIDFDKYLFQADDQEWRWHTLLWRGHIRNGIHLLFGGRRLYFRHRYKRIGVPS